MKFSHTRFGLACLTLSASALALGSVAHAQLDEIIVTAQKKEENLQDVPIAIAAFNLEQLETERIEGLEDIGRIAPGVNVTPNSADPNGVQINIRGIGILDPQIGQDARVAIYQDGIYIGKTQGLAFDMPDLARVEVLKGPQGTLYGRNTVAGAVNLVSAKPNADEFSGKIKAEYGNYNHLKGSAAVNIPVGDKSGVRLSGSYLSRDGWVENEGPGVDFGGERKLGLRAAFGTELTETVRVDISADYNNVEKEPLFYQSFGPGAQPFAAAIASFDDGRQETATTSFENERGDLVTKGVSLIATIEPSEGHVLKATASYRDAESSRFVTLVPTADPQILNLITGGFNQALAPLPFAFQATGQSGLLRSDWASAFSGNEPENGLFLSPPGGSKNLVHDQMSMDLTYTGEMMDGDLDYTLGGFYYSEDTSTGPLIQNGTNANDYLFVLGQFSPLVTAPNITAFLNSVNIPASAQGPVPAAGVMLQLLQNPALAPQVFPLLQQLVGDGTSCGANDMPSPANNFCIPTLSVSLASVRQSASNTLDIDTNAFALYGQATYNLTEQLRVTAGLRFSIENKNGVGQSYTPFFIDNLDFAGNVIPRNTSSYEDDILDPSLTLEYDVSDDMLVYGSYKESFRSGGFNAASVGLRIPGETFGADFNFGREDITAYEAGFKGTFLDNRARINAAGFLYDFKNVQTTVSLNPLISTSRAVANTDSEVYGFEVDGLFAFTDNISMRGSYSYTDGEVDDVINPVTGAISPRDELQGTPKNQYLVSLNYDGDFMDNEMFANITYSHKDDMLRVPEAGTRISAQDLLSASIGFGFDVGDKQAKLTFWGQNLTDDEYQIDAIGFDTFAHAIQVFGQPRSYGVSLGYDF